MNFNEGIAIIGRTGGGKTTIVRHLMRYLLKDSGCAWFTVKQDEADNAEKVILSSGRVRDLIRYAPCAEIRFNPITFEMGRKGGNALTLARILNDIHEVIHQSDKKGEGFWEGHFIVAMTHAINVVWIATRESATFELVYMLLSSSPETTAQAKSELFRMTKCGQLLQMAESHAMTEGEARQVIVAYNYFTTELPQAGEKVRGAVLSQVLNTLMPFTMPPLSDTVNGISNFIPSQVIEEGKCVIFDMDILTYGQQGQSFQLLHSFFFQEAILRRSNTTTPFVFVKDEYAHLAHAGRDIKAQTVARSQNYISIIGIQTLPVLEEGFGGGVEAKTKARAIYSCHVNKYMCNNNCSQTNDENSKIIGSERQLFFSMSPNQNTQPTGSLIDDFFGTGGMNFSANQTFHPLVEPRRFTQLKTGGKQNNLIVEAIYHDGFNHQLVTFKQG